MSFSRDASKVPTRLDTFGAGPAFEGAQPRTIPRSAPSQVLANIYTWISTLLRIMALLVLVRMVFQVFAVPLAGPAHWLMSFPDMAMQPFEHMAPAMAVASGTFHWAGIGAVGGCMLADSICRIVLRQGS